MEENYLLACSLWFLILLSWTAQDHLLSDGIIILSWALPCQSLIKKVYPQSHQPLSLSQSDISVYSAEGPSSLMTLACVKLKTKQANKTNTTNPSRHHRIYYNYHSLFVMCTMSEAEMDMPVSIYDVRIY